MTDQISNGTRARSLDSQPQALDRIHNGKEFNSALLKVEMRFNDIVEAAVTDPKDRKEMKHDFSMLLDKVGEAYDEAAGYEPEQAELLAGMNDETSELKNEIAELKAHIELVDNQLSKNMVSLTERIDRLSDRLEKHERAKP